MSEPTIADILLEVLQRPYYGGEPFTIQELRAIVQAEGLFARPPSAAAIRLRIGHLIKVGRVIPVGHGQFVARTEDVQR